MLEKIDVNKNMDKKEYKELMKELQPKLSMLQRKCRELKIPITILFEGFSASGKGVMISHLIEPLDPRGFSVYEIKRENEEEKAHPFLWRFFRKMPAKGAISILDRSWYTKVLRERLEDRTSQEELLYVNQEINDYEKLLTDDGMIIIKFFLYITKEEQKKRLKELESEASTAWRVNQADWLQNKHYSSYLRMNDEMLQKTDHEYAPWVIVEAMDEQYAAVKIYKEVIRRMEYACQKKENEMQAGKPESNDQPEDNDGFLNGVLNGIDLTASITKEDYKEKLKRLQSRLKTLQNEMLLNHVPAVFVFEGWDASGKGGAIKRLTQKLDPRGYEVIPISAPDETERAHHYLWRFYQHIPEAGHMAIFDRSWYGRVMVERIEGFCSEKEWSRAYREINQFEEQLADAGAVVIKFWLHIDKEEQMERFQARENTPGKEWKITEEDWRNRSKWDEYAKAVDEMIVRTSTTYAPWVVVEADSKQYARIKVLETVVEALEKKMKKIKK